MRVFLIVVVLALVIFAVNSAAYTVDRTEFVYVTQFGEHVATYDGVADGGLHWKWPWPVQSIQRLDRRLQYFDLPETEVLTHAPRRLNGNHAAALLGAAWPGVLPPARSDEL